MIAAPPSLPASCAGLLQGLLQDVPAILLVGGGEGMGKLQATVQQLDLKLQGKAQVRQQQA